MTIKSAIIVPDIHFNTLSSVSILAKRFSSGANSSAAAWAASRGAPAAMKASNVFDYITAIAQTCWIAESSQRPPLLPRTKVQASVASTARPGSPLTMTSCPPGCAAALTM
jgi:hypothetical protein